MQYGSVIGKKSYYQKCSGYSALTGGDTDFFTGQYIQIKYTKNNTNLIGLLN